MSVVLYQVLPPGRTDIRAIGHAKGCPLLNFFAEQRSAAPTELAKLMALLRYVAAQGVPRNEQKCRHLEDGLFEFKSGCLRVVWFWDEGHLILCSHGFVKKRQKTPRDEIDRGKSVRDAYENARRAGTLSLKE